MFKCQFSGEVSLPAVYKTEKVNERTEDGRWSEKTARSLLSPPEKPVKVVIKTRNRSYQNTIWSEDDGRIDFETTGAEIVEELTIRAKHLDAVKAKYGLA